MSRRLLRSVPRSPFSTPLSGSAREVEERIRNIFQYKKKRPPLFFLLLSCVLALTCGGLVSCEGQEAAEAQSAPTPLSAWMEPELGTTSLGTVLGYPMTVTHTVEEYNEWYDYQPVHWYDYQVQLPDGTWSSLTVGNAPSFPLDLDGDGQEELIINDPVNGGHLLVLRRYPDGSVRKLDLRDSAMDRLGLSGEGHPLLDLEVRPEDGTAAVRSPGDPTQELAVFPLSQLLAETHSGAILLSAPGEDGTPEPFYSENPSDGSTAYFYQGMDLDGAGGLDDGLTVTSCGADVGGETRVEITLGTGEVLTWTEPGYYFPVALPGYLRRTGRQSLVLELDAPYSNYGGALYVVLEVEGGALVEQARLELDGDGLSLLHSAYLQEGVDGLQELRVPALLDKWHSPVWSTFSWDGTQSSTVSDGYFTDTEVLSLPDGGELTLKLIGKWVLDDWGLSELYYSQVQVLDGDTLLQTILPQFPLPSPQAFDADTAEQVTPPASCYPAHGFSADLAFHTLDLRDINFDGFPDLGLPCDTTHNDIHAWYLWDPSSQQFQYAFALQGALTVEQAGQLLLEKRWEEETHLYSFNARGQLVWQGPA